MDCFSQAGVFHPDHFKTLHNKLGQNSEVFHPTRIFLPWIISPKQEFFILDHIELSTRRFFIQHGFSSHRRLLPSRSFSSQTTLNSQSRRFFIQQGFPSHRWFPQAGVFIPDHIELSTWRFFIQRGFSSYRWFTTSRSFHPEPRRNLSNNSVEHGGFHPTKSSHYGLCISNRRFIPDH